MKKILFSLACLLMLATSAAAAVTSFNKITVDVPSGWTSNEEGPTVSLIAPGNAAAMSIVYDKTGGLSADQLVNAMASQLKGTKPVKDEGVYTFSFTNNNVKTECVMVVEDGEYALFSMTDPSGKFSEQFKKIIDSVETK